MWRQAILVAFVWIHHTALWFLSLLPEKPGGPVGLQGWRITKYGGLAVLGF
jgi:hypothetical protein